MRDPSAVQADMDSAAGILRGLFSDTDGWNHWQSVVKSLSSEMSAAKALAASTLLGAEALAASTHVAPSPPLFIPPPTAPSL